MDLLVPTLSAEDSHARTSRLLGIVRDWMESEAGSGTNIYGWSESFGLLGSLSKTSLASYLRTKAKTSRSSSPGLPNAGMVWRGACWIARIGESHSGAVACSLSGILEPHAPSKYCLSPKACAGILKRALKRGRKLPGPLEAALVAVAGQAILTGAEPTSHPLLSQSKATKPAVTDGESARMVTPTHLTEPTGRPSSRQRFALQIPMLREGLTASDEMVGQGQVTKCPSSLRESAVPLPEIRNLDELMEGLNQSPQTLSPNPFGLTDGRQ